MEYQLSGVKMGFGEENIYIEKIVFFMQNWTQFTVHDVLNSDKRI